MKNTKSFLIGQASTKSKSRSNYYDWEIWIEDGDLSLDLVEKVDYLLHPTFPNPLRSSSDRTQKFKLKSSGWGEFLIKIIIYEKSGKLHNMTHYLTLDDNYINVKSPNYDQERTGKVFLSYANADTRLAQNLETKLKELGYSVSSPSDIQPGSTVKNFIVESINSSDAVIAINPDITNHWQNEELEIAKKAEVKTIIFEGYKNDSSLSIGSKTSNLEDILDEDSIKYIYESLNNL